jgi:outer membrane protein assembly factor BamB
LKKYILVSLFVLPFLSCTRSPSILWTTPTDGPVYGSPAYKDGLVFIGSQDKNLYALKAQDGSIAWKMNLLGIVVSTPLIRNEFLYIGSGNGDFHSINFKTGKSNWVVRTEGLIHFEACSDETGVYFGNDRGQFLKLNYQGQVLWTFKATNKLTSTCDFYKDFVLTSSWDSNFYAINKHDGSVAWKVSSGTLNYGGPQIVKDEVYFATHDLIYRIDAQTGVVRNKIKTPYLVYVLFKDGYLWTNEIGLSKRKLNGEIVASVPFRSNSSFKPVPGPGIFVMGGDSSSLYGVSEDLKIIWKLKQSEAFWSSGVINDNVYYTGNRNNNVYAIELPKP